MDAACSVSLQPLPAPGALFPSTLQRSTLPHWCTSQHMHTHTRTPFLTALMGKLRYDHMHSPSWGWQRIWILKENHFL